MPRPLSTQAAEGSVTGPRLRELRVLLTMIAVVAAALLGTGCVTAQIEQVRHSATGIERGERIVILARQHHNSHEAENDFMQCVGNALQRGGRGLEMASREDFINGLYPWFEPATAPLSAEELPALLARPGVAEQLTLTGVRYVVWMDGMTDRVDGGGSLACAISPAGGGCFGLGWWETDSNYEAAIWDLKTFDQAGVISTDYTGRSVVPAVVIPIPFIARTQANACRGMADQLHEFLVVGDAPIG